MLLTSVGGESPACLRLGSPVGSGDTTRSEGGDHDDDGMLYGDTQALDDDDETQAVDDEFEEQEEGVAGETQLVEDSEEEGVDVAEQTQAVEVEEDEDGGSTEDEAGDLAKTQLVEEREAEGGGNTDWVKTQLVQECQEEERVNDSGDEADAIDWGMTQRVEDTDEEVGDDGDDELSEGTQVQRDDEGLQNDERDVEEHDDADDVADSDASMDEEGGTAREAFTTKSSEQGKRQAMANGTFPLTEIVQNSTSCSTSLADCADCGLDDGSYGYVQSHDKDGSKSKGRCSTAKKLFADTVIEESESKSRRFSGLSYLNSQEPGDLSQANALEVVEGLISINGGLSSQEPTPKKLGKAKPPVSIKMGTLRLAEKVDRCRSSNGKPEIFAWVDSQEDDGGGDFFSKNKDVLLHQSTGKRKSKIPRPKKCSTKIAPVDNKQRECKRRTDSNVRGKIETLPSSDSRLLKSEVKTKRTSGKRSKKNLLNDLDCLSNAKPVERQKEKVSVNLHDVGQDTQMDVLAIEALAQSSPAENLSAEDELPVNRDLRVGSRAEKSQLKNGPPRKRTSSIQEGVMTRSKRIKVTELNQKPQKKRQRGIQSQENSEDRGTKTNNKQAKSVQQNNKIAKIVDGNKYASTPIAHRTRHTGRNNLYEYSELGPNKHLKKGMNLTGDNSTTGEVRNNHTAHEPERPMISERITGYGSDSVVKESSKHTFANNAQNLQQNSGASIQHSSANVSENLEPFRDEPTTHVSRREPSSHPKQRRTPTAKLQAKAPAVTQTAADHEIQPEVVRSPKKRRVFIKRSELLTYARRERSNGSISMLSSIIPQSSAVSPILNSSKRVNNKSSGFGSSDQKRKEPSGVRDASNSPKSNSPVLNSALKTPSKMVNKLSPTFSPLNPSKASSRSLSKPSIARELLELDPENTLSSRHRKDSRRKDMASASILFSHHLDEDVIKRQKKILARLGVREAFSVSDATHFVADGFFRTKNMLEAMALGKLVVTSMWLESCGEAGCYVNDKKYILRDAKKEKEIGFSMPISLTTASKHPLLLGKRVFVTQNVKPSRQVLTSLVSASSGQPLERIGRSINKEREAPDDLLVISCEEDYETCVALLEKGVNVYEAELILNGIVTQKLEYERHGLFSDRVRQTRSTRWLKDDARGRFVPVSRS
ncbi:hypothetical protein ACQ4PT_049684 [Festuca glaucescens]